MRIPTSRLRKSRIRGFSILEVLIASVVLTVGLLGGVVLLSVATASNSRSKFDTTATTLAESVMERIVSIPENATGPAAQSSITDCTGSTFLINTAVGGAALNATNDRIDFAQAAPSGNYSMRYVVCSSNANVTYEVRWRIDNGPVAGTQLVTVGAKVLNASQSHATLFAFPVNIRTLRGD